MPNVFFASGVNKGMSSGSVGPVSSTILAANQNRISATFTNDGSNTIYLHFGADAVAGQGIRLNSGGGSFELSPSANLFSGTVFGITSSGTSNIAYAEFDNQLIVS